MNSYKNGESGFITKQCNFEKKNDDFLKIRIECSIHRIKLQLNKRTICDSDSDY